LSLDFEEAYFIEIVASHEREFRAQYEVLLNLGPAQIEVSISQRSFRCPQLSISNGGVCEGGILSHRLTLTSPVSVRIEVLLVADHTCQ
jgi:hypothetical protein